VAGFGADEPRAVGDDAGPPRLLRRRPERGAARSARTPTGARESGTFRIAFGLFLTTVVTSVFGFAFWVVAARTYTASAVGSGSAAISAMQFIATFAVVGLGTLLIAELSARRGDPATLITTAVLVTSVLGALGALVFGVLAPRIGGEGAEALSSAVGLAMFVVMAALTAVMIVLDDAVIGLGRTSWQVWRNLVFALAKLVALPLPLLLWATGDPRGVVAAWLLGTVLSAMLLVELMRRGGAPLAARPQWDLLSRLRRAAMAHHWLNVAQGSPRLLQPVLVAAYLSPAVNASFYTAVLLVQFPHIVPGHLATALFAVSSRDTTALQREIQRAMRVFLPAAVASALAFGFVSGPMLSVFGPGYERASTALSVLGLATIPAGIKAFYMAGCRIKGDLGRAAAVCMGGSVAQVLAAWVALLLGGGVVQVSIAWVAAQTAEAIIMWPAVAAAGDLPGRPGPQAARLMRWTAPRTLAGPG
jgi:O-antigen/teichoic acid export membrane protein